MTHSCQFIREVCLQSATGLMAWSVSVANVIAYTVSLTVVIGFFSIADMLKLVKILHDISIYDFEPLFICICINIFRRLVLVCTKVESPRVHCVFAGITLFAIQLMLGKLGYFDITGLFLAIMILILELALTTRDINGSLVSKLRYRFTSSTRSVHPRSDPEEENTQQPACSQTESVICIVHIDSEPGSAPEQCPVCLQEMTGVHGTSQEGTLQGAPNAICKLKCNHMFHYDCITKWTNIKNTCPVCRA